MKKLLALLLAAVMLLGIVGCAARTAAPAATPTEEPVEEPVKAPVEEPEITEAPVITEAPAVTEAPAEPEVTEAAVAAEPAEEPAARGDSEPAAEVPEPDVTAEPDETEYVPLTEPPYTEPDEIDPEEYRAFAGSVPVDDSVCLSFDFEESDDGDEITGYVTVELAWSIPEHAFKVHVYVKQTENGELSEFLEGLAFYRKGEGVALTKDPDWGWDIDLIEPDSDPSIAFEELFKVLEKVDFNKLTWEDIPALLEELQDNELLEAKLDAVEDAIGDLEDFADELEEEYDGLKEALIEAFTSESIVNDGWRFKEDDTELGHVYSISPDLEVLIRAFFSAAAPYIKEIDGLTDEEIGEELEELLDELKQTLGDYTCAGEYCDRYNGDKFASFFFAADIYDAYYDDTESVSINIRASLTDRGNVVISYPDSFDD